MLLADICTSMFFTGKSKTIMALTPRQPSRYILLRIKTLGFASHSFEMVILFGVQIKLPACFNNKPLLLLSSVILVTLKL